MLGIARPTPVHALPATGAFEGYAGQEAWEAPPQEFNDVQRHGFHDGIVGARKDYGNNRRPDVNNRDEFRDPDDLPRDIPPQMRDVYRGAFRRGYAVAASHLWNIPLPLWAQPHPNWEWGMRGFRTDAERQGYRDGIEEARGDFMFHRNTDPDDQPQYQHPNVAPPLVAPYRSGFLRGYTVALTQLTGEPAWSFEGDPGTWQPPNSYSEFMRRGFRDGIDGARKDFGNNRYPDPNNRDEYRNPNVPPQVRFQYRQGFRRGYERAAARLWGK
jgi:hypothetical protein